MVRFSDLLGGNDAPEDKPGAEAAPAHPDDDGTEADDDASPEDVLERLTQYATSTRAPEPEAFPTPDAPPDPPGPDAPPASFRDVVPDAVADAPPAFTPDTDDLLPRGKGKKRRS